MFIYPYRIGSNSINQLRAGLNAKLIRLEGSRFKGGPDKNVINWGNSAALPELDNCNLLNHPSVVAFASNKLNFFNTVVGQVSIPDFTVDRGEAYAWIESGKMVCVREKLTGHSGEGLVILKNDDEWQEYNHNDAKLYVKYIPKKDEYRVHVFKGEVFDVQRKGIEANTPREFVNFQVRNAAGGFIFLRNEDQSKYPEQIYAEAKKAMELIGLDFGAVDIIWNEYRKTAYVLEVNTAPGLTGTTLTNYIDQFAKYFNVEGKHPILKAAIKREPDFDEGDEYVDFDDDPLVEINPVDNIINQATPAEVRHERLYINFAPVQVRR